MGIVSKSVAREEASNRQAWDAEHRTAKLDLSHADQAVATKKICFSKSAVMYDAVMKLHLHHLNPLHHQI